MDGLEARRKQHQSELYPEVSLWNLIGIFVFVADTGYSMQRVDVLSGIFVL